MNIKLQVAGCTLQLPGILHLETFNLQHSLILPKTYKNVKMISGGLN